MSEAVKPSVLISEMSFREVKETWKALHQDPDSLQTLRPIIYDSWERSRQYQISPYAKSRFFSCTQEEFSRALEQSRHMVSCALPVMEKLLEYFQGTGFVVGLVDAGCVTLKAVGDPEALAWGRQANLSEGSVWTEEKVGTNAAALCMSLMRPVTICGYEHYCLYGIVSAACFCPLVDDGRLVGAFGMVAPYDKLTRHTLGMVFSSAMHIQSMMHLQRSSAYQKAVMDSMSDGLLAVDEHKRVTHFNHKCSAMLGIAEEAAIGSKLYNILSDSGDNQYFFSILAHNMPVTDEYVLLDTGREKIRCSLSCTPILGSSQGTVVILREYERVNQMVGKWLGRNAKMTFRDVIGQAPEFRKVVKAAQTAAASSSNVLLLGESGTGKDIIAQAMHNESYRRKKPFVAVNCAALPRELIASELFGYEEGAFTGAKKGGNVGKFELADQGTLFLDEIGDIPIDLQATLLRVLEEKCIQRLGGSKLVPVNVRIVAATNKNLSEEIEKNRFRRDLYYRLGVIKLVLPSLRQRRQDIPLLAEHFLTGICARFGREPMRFSGEAIELMQRYDWPGNVREMQNVIECLVQFSPTETIGDRLVSAYLSVSTPPPEPAAPEKGPRKLEELERERIRDCLSRRMTKEQIAVELGISRRTLYRHMKRYGLL